MPYLDSPDTLIANLTLEGRNLLGRVKIGDAVYKQLGWQLGRGGYQMTNPVKVSDIVDPATEAIGVITVADNGASAADWDAGTYVSLNGKKFIYGQHFSRGSTAAETARNIKNAILDPMIRDIRHYRIVEPIDGGSDLYIRSLITGAIGNSYPIAAVNKYPYRINLTYSPMSSGVSASLEDPAWPIPPSDPLLPPIVLPYSGTDGLIEMPTAESLSFLSRVGENQGMGAYGELGLWAEVLQSTFPAEIGRRVLFAVAHFPIQPKMDRAVITFRVIISF